MDTMIEDDVASLLRSMNQSCNDEHVLDERPGDFMRDLYLTWHENGGLEGGRPRNSIRRMRQIWLVEETQVRSLHPKLTGGVRLSKRDAQHLVDLFLSRWRYAGNAREENATEDGYVPFPAKNLQRLKKSIVERIFPKGSAAAREGILLPGGSNQNLEEDEVSEARKVFAPIIHDSEFVIVISRYRTVIGPAPDPTMRMFWHLVNDWYLDDQKRSSHKKAMMWVLDMGSRIVEDEGSFAAFHNAGFLALLFRAFATFVSLKDDQGQHQTGLLQKLVFPGKLERTKRWEWLVSKAIISVMNLQPEEREAAKLQNGNTPSILLKDIGISGENLLPHESPGPWRRHLRALYGDKMTDFAETTITIHFREEGWQGEDGEKKQVRYLAHAGSSERAKTTLTEDDENIGWAFQSIELPTPGTEYDEAFKILTLAGEHRLQEKTNEEEISEQSVAYAYIRKLGFDVLKVTEFLKIYAGENDKYNAV